MARPGTHPEILLPIFFVCGCIIIFILFGLGIWE
jgi:hypothetical protein